MKNKILPFEKELPVFGDDRGIFVPFISEADNITKKKLKIKRAYYVYNYGKGVIRGFHFHKKEWKFFTIINGAAKFVALDPKSPSKSYSFVSSSRKPNLIVIPPGFANGWISLEENTILLAASTLTTQQSLKDDKRFDPYGWGDLWKVEGR